MAHGAGAPHLHTTRTTELVAGPRIVQAAVNKTSVELLAKLRIALKGERTRRGVVGTPVISTKASSPVNEPDMHVVQPGPHLYMHAPLPRCRSRRQPARTLPTTATYFSVARTLPHGLVQGSTLPSCSPAAC
jgi:hypothetical protein